MVNLYQAVHELNVERGFRQYVLSRNYRERTVTVYVLPNAGEELVEVKIFTEKFIEEASFSVKDYKTAIRRQHHSTIFGR